MKIENLRPAELFKMNYIDMLDNKKIDLSGPLPLFDAQNHMVYWVGGIEDSIFRCNTYLIRDGNHNYLIDPGGSVTHFPEVLRRIKMLMPPSDITHIIVNQYDPVICASIPLWLKYNKDIIIITDSRIKVLMSQCCIGDGRYCTIDSEVIALPSGGELRFIKSPFIHSPGAFIAYDSVSRFLFSGDICATVNDSGKLIAEDIESHLGLIGAFLEKCIVSDKAIRDFLDNIKDIEIDAILPRRGSIIKKEFVKHALNCLKGFKSGHDVTGQEV